MTGKWDGRRPSDEELQQILRNHQEWLNSEGVEGERADLTGANLEGVSISIQHVLDEVAFAESMALRPEYRDPADWYDCIYPDLTKADFSFANLHKASFCESDFCEADFTQAKLAHSELYSVGFRGANLSKAELSEIYCGGVDFTEATFAESSAANVEFDNCGFTRADLSGSLLSDVKFQVCDFQGACFDDSKFRDATFQGTTIKEADFTRASFSNCAFLDSTLDGMRLSAALIRPPCIVDWRSIARSLNIPGLHNFLVQTGMPELFVTNAIDSLRTIDPGDLFTMLQTVFISYGGPDEAFAERLREDLEDSGVKTWFFPKDSDFGARLHRVMHKGIDKYDRMVLICSEHSLVRPGVLNEIERALAKEAKTGGGDVLLPITLDDYIFDGWDPGPERQDLIEQLTEKVVADFRHTRERRTPKYQEQLGRLLKALRKRPDTEER